MEITEVKVALRDHPQTRLKAYATLTFDHCFVVRNIKIIEGKSGLFVAMPSRKPKVGCAKCQFKSDVGGRFCSQCGTSLVAVTPTPGAGELEASEGMAHRDIAHPITTDFRQRLQHAVFSAYEAEKVKGGMSSPQSGGGATDEDAL